jgi:hypothetical protein
LLQGTETPFDLAFGLWTGGDQMGYAQGGKGALKLRTGRSTGYSPNVARDKSLEEKCSAIRPCLPSTLLDLRLPLHLRRRVNADNQIHFLGRTWPIAPTQRATSPLIHHPLRRFWVVTQPPSPAQNTWPEILGNCSL